MAEDKEIKIVDIQLNYEKTVRGLAELEKNIIAAKEAQAEMQAELKKAGITEEEYNKQTEALVQNRAELANLQRQRAKMQKELANQMKIEQEQVGSLNAMRAELSNLTAAYDALSQADRESAEGFKLRDQIKELSDALKDAEEATGRYYRNVGNYTNSVIAAFKSLDDELEKMQKEYEKVAREEGATSEKAEELRRKISQQEQAINSTKAATQKLYSTIIPFGDKILPLLGKGLAGAKEGLRLVADGAKIVGKQFLALMANPIVAFLAAAAAAIAILTKGISGSEENMNKWRKAMAPLQRALALLQSGIEAVCGWILTGIEYAGKFAQILGRVAEAATSFLPGISSVIHDANEAVERAIELEAREQKLTQDRRALLVQEAKTEMEVAELRNKAQDKNNTSIEERLAANAKAIAQEKAIADERLRLATEEFEILKERADWAGNSAEDNDKLAQAEAALYKARSDYAKKTKELLASQITLENELVSERKETLALRRQAQDQEVAIIENGAEKQRQATENQFNRQIEDLRLRLETEKTLTAEQQKAINDTIIGLKKSLAKSLEAIQREADAKLLSLRREAEDAEINLIENQAERNRAALLASYNRQIEDLKRTLEQEKGLTTEEREAINAKILALQKTLDRELEQADADEQARQRDILRAEEDARLAIIRDANDRARAQTLANYDRQIEDLKWRLETEKGLTETEINAINSMIVSKGIERANALAKVEEDAAKQDILRLKNDFAEKMQAAEDNSLTLAQLELQLAEEERATLHQNQEESDEEFHARQIEAEKRYQDAKKKLANTEVQVQQAKFQMISAISGGFSKALEALGEDNKAFAKLSKALALGEIAVNTGKAIAAGTAQAQSVPYPANLVAIATTVATVLANVATAISTVKQAKFAAGVVGLSGRGSSTSDSIPAFLSSGESVMNAAATSLFANELQAMNNIGRSVTPEIGGVTMNNAQPSMLGEAIREAVADIRPVVTVEDINTQQQRVEVMTRRGFL